MKRLALLISVLLTTIPAVGQTAIGQWQDHCSFKTARSVAVGKERVYAATRMSMFYYDRDDYSTEALTKVKGLSDAGISTFAYDDQTGALVIAYTNSNIDIRRDGTVHNLSDIKYSSIGGDKTIYHIRFDQGRAYLATGFGVVVVDLDRYEIIETYYLGEDGDQGTVYDVAFTDSLVYVGTDNGFLYAPKHSKRLHVYDTWTRSSDLLLIGSSVRQLAVNPGHGWLRAMTCSDNPDSLTAYFQHDGGRWECRTAGDARLLRVRNGCILLVRKDTVEVYDSDYRLLKRIADVPEYGLAIYDADIDSDSTLWMAHNWAGLVSLTWRSGESRKYQPQGPHNDDYVYGITTTRDNVYMTPGGKRPTYEGTFIDGDPHILWDNKWFTLDRGTVDAQFRDVLQVVTDPGDTKHVFATAWGYGVLEYKDGVLQQLYDRTNTGGVLVPYTDGSYVHYRVSGMVMDGDGNLWVTNSLVNNGLVVRYKDGSWKGFNTTSVLKGKHEIDKIIWDSVNNCLWFAGRDNYIFAHNGQDMVAYVDPNGGSKLQTHSVNCLVQDRSGDIWFGTDKGIKVIYDGYRAFANGGRGELSPVSCSNILFNEDGINEYLMAYENVSCIAVDGANRKWVGTANNGLYLISANGQEQLAHYTTANSPLASDKIVALAVQPVFGEVYVGTDKGLQSYHSNATEADAQPEDEIRVFPNPVKPDYDGPIAIRGFTRDAQVHITDVRGHVVYSTTAFGGQAIWDGRTLDGEKVASGPYLVFASDEMGQNQSVAKILVIR